MSRATTPCRARHRSLLPSVSRLRREFVPPPPFSSQRCTTRSVVTIARRRLLADQQMPVTFAMPLLRRMDCLEMPQLHAAEAADNPGKPKAVARYERKRGAPPFPHPTPSTRTQATGTDGRCGECFASSGLAVCAPPSVCLLVGVERRLRSHVADLVRPLSAARQRLRPWCHSTGATSTARSRRGISGSSSSTHPGAAIASA